MNPVFTAAGMFSIIIIIYIVIPHVYKKIIRYRFLNTQKMLHDIYLTFDDGPDPESTTAILKILQNSGFSATFFISGKNGEMYPELVRILDNSNCTVGNHGYAHIHPWKSGPAKTILDIINMEKYFSSFKERILLYRPPYGKFNLLSLIFFLIKKYRIIFWDIDPEDYKSDDPENSASEIIKQIKPGSVILLHDGRADADNQSDVSVTVAIVELLVKYALNNNLNISHIEQ